MLEVIYRIYEIPTEKQKEEKIELQKELGWGYSTDLDRTEITMDILVCESRDRFKELAREQYGEDLMFARPRKPQGGELYCVIIGEHAYTETMERLFQRTEYICEFCGKTVRGFIQDKTKLENYEIKHSLLGQDDKYKHLNFCSHRCRDGFKERERANYSDEQATQGLFITKDSFTNNVTGYIYKITKKSTGEFYVGQTIYAPVFRWGQHLKTERFKIGGILDYKFEVLEIVPKGVNILERETHFIHTMYNENPGLCLNEINLGKKGDKDEQIKCNARTMDNDESTPLGI